MIISRYLVLIERATFSGFRALIEAREFLLNHVHREEFGGKGEVLGKAVDVIWLQSDDRATILAPCPHDGPCPLTLKARWIPCTTPVFFQRPAPFTVDFS